MNNTFFELLPLVVFFLVYYITKNIFLATGVCIVVSWLNLALYKLKYKYIDKKIWLSTILITIFGGLTIIFHNKTFVMLKPTVLFWLIAISLLISKFYYNKNLFKSSIGQELNLPNEVWNTINSLWIVFFIILGAINLFIAFNYPEDIWVKFKVFGSFSLTIVFTFITIGYIYYKKR